MGKRLLSLAPLGLLAGGCATEQTHFGITLPTQTWINVVLGGIVVGFILLLWGLFTMVRWFLRGRR